MRKSTVLLIIALIAVICCTSAVSAGLFDMNSDKGPIAAEIINSTVTWDTESIVTGVEGDSVRKMGGVTSFSIDENGRTDATFNTSDVNNFNGTLEIKLTNASESQIKEIQKLGKNMVHIDAVVDDSNFNQSIYGSCDGFEFDGKVIKTNFTFDHQDKIVDGEGSAKIKSGNLTLSNSNDEIKIVF